MYEIVYGDEQFRDKTIDGTDSVGQGDGEGFEGYIESKARVQV